MGEQVEQQAVPLPPLLPFVQREEGNERAPVFDTAGHRFWRSSLCVRLIDMSRRRRIVSRSSSLLTLSSAHGVRSLCGLRAPHLERLMCVLLSCICFAACFAFACVYLFVYFVVFVVVVTVVPLLHSSVSFFITLSASFLNAILHVCGYGCCCFAYYALRFSIVSIE